MGLRTISVHPWCDKADRFVHFAADCPSALSVDRVSQYFRAMQHWQIRRSALALVIALTALTLKPAAQSVEGRASQILRLDELPALLDSATVVPGSLSIHAIPSGDSLSGELFQVMDNTLFLRAGDKKVLQEIDSIKVTYHLLPFFLGNKINRIDTNLLIGRQGEVLMRPVYDPLEEQRGNLLALPVLDYTGSFARGFSVGNNQSLVLNSAFNLQMSGDLGDGLQLNAAISDNTIPIQPDGNTQLIQEFDKVFIQLRKEQHSLTAGDYNLPRPTGYFMNYYRKLQGLRYDLNELWSNGANLRARATAAVSRGKFSRNSLVPIEGNQGPYKLSGAEGERFITILAGSEKVFVDGILLKRGEDLDYVMDYNRGEIIFTRNRLITKDVRPIIEFEYVEQNYTRSLLTLSTEYSSGPIRTYFNLYSEQDSKTASGDLQLTSEDKQLLSESGDNSEAILKNTIDLPDEGFNSNRIMYALRDSMIASQVYPDVLVYSTDPTEALYTATFSEVGAQRGNYILSNVLSANGRVYQWVAPDPITGLPSGSFEPVIRLVSPKLKQLYSAGAEFTPNDRTRLSTELSVSNNDLNRFSALDDADNTGVALKSTASRNLQLTDRWQIDLSGAYEMVDSKYRALNPYRNAEFSRDWNLPVDVPPTSEHLPALYVQVHNGSSLAIGYAYDGLYRQNLYDGTRHGINGNLTAAGFALDFDATQLRTRQSGLQTQFTRPKFDLRKTLDSLDGFYVGLAAELEENKLYRERPDSLFGSSFYYDQYKVYAGNPETRNLHFLASYTRRNDRLPLEGALTAATLGDHLAFAGKWSQGKNSRLGWNFNYRQLTVFNDDLVSQSSASTVLGRLNYFGRFAKGMVRYNNSFELGSGREPRLEFKYVQVQEGEGTYIWVDDGDGVEEINEFEIAPFPDEANYIRLSVLNNNFVATNTNAFNQSLRVNLRSLGRNADGIRQALSKFSLVSTLKYDRKTEEDEGGQFWNPLYSGFPDTAIIALNSNFRNILYFNQSDPIYDMQFGLIQIRSRFAQTVGSEERKNREYYYRLRWNWSSSLNFVLRGTWDNRRLAAENFAARNYDLQAFEIAPELTYLFTQNLRLAGKYRFRNQENQIGSGESATTNDISIETTFRKTSQTTLRAKLTIANIAFEGPRNSPTEFAMLQGLKPGTNTIWSAQFDTRLTSSILLSFSYNGRNTGNNRTVHTGNAQLRASF